MLNYYRVTDTDTGQKLVLVLVPEFKHKTQAMGYPDIAISKYVLQAYEALGYSVLTYRYNEVFPVRDSRFNQPEFVSYNKPSNQTLKSTIPAATCCNKWDVRRFRQVISKHTSQLIEQRSQFYAEDNQYPGDHEDNQYPVDHDDILNGCACPCCITPPENDPECVCKHDNATDRIGWIFNLRDERTFDLPTMSNTYD